MGCHGGVADDLYFWPSVANLPAATSFPASQWELRHHLEYLKEEPPPFPSGLPAKNRCNNRHLDDDAGLRLPSHSAAFPPIESTTFQGNAVREVELVRHCMYALQGIPVAVTQLEKLSKRFSYQAADRSSHRLPTLWQRSASTNALGKLLAVMAEAGRLRCQLEQFTDFFLRPEQRGNTLHTSAGSFTANGELQCADSSQNRRGRVKVKHKSRNQSLQSAGASNKTKQNLVPPYSLVNQAFAAATRSILQGHLAALNTLTASVLHRRSNDAQESTDSTLSNEQEGPVIGLGCENITLVELHLHTSELRLQLHVLAAICLFDSSGKRHEVEKRVENGDGNTDGLSGFGYFPKGADLLTYLYNQLKVADSLHVELLRFLFSRACQPYLVFIRSWLYRAIVKDPYQEFIVDEAYGMACTVAFQKSSNELPLTSLKVREAVSVPCFLKDVCTPLLRAGQQLQVLLKLAETGEFVEAVRSFASGSKYAPANVGLAMLEDALNCWTDLSSEKSLFAPVLIFSKEKLEELIKQRERTNRDLMEKFDRLFARLNLQCQRGGTFEQSNVFQLGQSNVLNTAHDTYDKHSPEFESGQDFSCTSPESNQNGHLRQPISTADSKQVKDVAGESTDDLKLPEEVCLKLTSFSGPGNGTIELGQDLRELKLNEANGRCSHNSSYSGMDDYAPHKNHSSESANGQPALVSRVKVDKGCISSRMLSTLSGTRMHGSVRKQRRRWKEPLEVIIVHSNLEEDTGSPLSACEDEREQELCKTLSFISDYQRGTIWPQEGLPLNPFLDSGSVRGTASHEYTLPAFKGVDRSWDIVAKVQDEEDCEPFFSEWAQNKANNGSSDLCLEKVGPEKFFGRTHIRKLGQKYGQKDFSMAQNNRYGKSLPSFDVVSSELWSLEACIMDRSVDLELLPVIPSSTSTKALNSINVKGLDTRSICTDNLDCAVAMQDVQYKITEQPIELHEDHKKKLPSSRYAIDFSQHDCSTREGITSLKQDTVDDIMVDGAVEHGLLRMHPLQIGVRPETFYGGASWESSLKLIEDQETAELDRLAGDHRDKMEIPLEVVVDKCIIQEILSQYHSVSNFAVRLLHEIFGLQDHLTALRRYFFMERGDWADGFTEALCQHAWYPTGAHQRQLEVQGMLETALQRSYCEEDEYSERLYVYIEGTERINSLRDEHSVAARDGFGSTYVNHNCVDAFDFIMLGYKVEWPLSLILTSDSFKLYNSIFSFLVRTKLTVHALGDIWRCLKDLVLSSKRGSKDPNVQQWQERIRMLMLFRQQIGHFVTTLQDYVESQVLHVVWSRFLHAIHDEVKDMQDLETLHKAYLNDALHQSFLSDEMKPIKACIDQIMQCLLDLRSCLYYTGKQGKDGQFDIGSDKVYSRVLEVKTQYERCIQQLYQLRSENHNQMSLSYFWMHLDFNGFLADTCSRMT